MFTVKWSCACVHCLELLGLCLSSLRVVKLAALSHCSGLLSSACAGRAVYARLGCFYAMIWFTVKHAFRIVENVQRSCFTLLDHPDTLYVSDVCFVNKYVGRPYSRTKIYTACMLYAADDVHRLPLHGFAAAVLAASGTDKWTDRHSTFYTLSA